MVVSSGREMVIEWMWVVERGGVNRGEGGGLKVVRFGRNEKIGRGRG